MSKSKILLLSVVILIAHSVGVMADDTGIFTINAAPRGILPVGESSDYFKLGYGADLSLDYSHNEIPLLFGRLRLNLDYIPLLTEDEFSLFSVSAGPGLLYRPIVPLSLSVSAAAGYFFGSLTDGSGTPGGNLSLSAGAAVSYDLTPAIGISISGDYIKRFHLFNGIDITLGIVIHPGEFKPQTSAIGNTIEMLESLSPGISGDGLDVSMIEFNQIFPVLFKYYDKTPIGKVVLFNNENKAVTDIKLSLDVDRYMDNPKQSPIIKSIGPGESVAYDIYALFNDSVLDITEGTKVSSNIILKYKYRDREITRKYTVSMDLYDRNAITWDDDRKAAAFVTAKDPAVLELAKNISGWIKEESPAAIDKNLCIAMGIHSGLGIYGINYQIDPKTPFSKFSADKLSVDFLQFPRQTLSYSSGDCDDLSILYSAMLEALGIETAFITVPGHIFMAFALNMGASEARRTFLKHEDLIIIDDKVWVPIEITLIQDDFLKTWAEGAKEWREYEPSGKAVLYPMHDSWEDFQPVGLPGTIDISIPEKTAVVNVFSAELKRFIDREIYPKVESITAQIELSNKSSKYINRLGVLYAKYGLNDKAETEFSKVLNKEEYVPSLINMGNIRYLQNNMKGALEYYDRAKLMEPENPTVLVSVARANHELENYGTVIESYNLLKNIAPELSEKFTYLELRGEEADRASNAANQKEIVVWDEN